MLFIQEPRLKDGKVGTLDKACNWPNSKVQGWFTSNERGNGGVATIVKKSFLEQTTNFLVEEVAEDECQHISFSVGLTQFSFANVHMSSHSGDERATLCTTLRQILPEGTITGGDFNMVQDIDLDTQRAHSITPYENGGWQELLELQSTLHLNDPWREANGDMRLYTHESHVASGTTRTRIDYVLCPKEAMVGHYGLSTSHDYTFWQGTARADHIGVTIKVAPVDPSEVAPKRRAASPHIFETQEWHALHEVEWEAHILTATEYTTVWEWWEVWKLQVIELAKTLEDKLSLLKSRAERQATQQAKLAHEFAAAHPGPAAQSAVAEATLQIDTLHDTMAHRGKKARLTYGVDVACHMHPAFLAQAKEAHSKTTIPHLQRWDTYFGLNPKVVSMTQCEADKLEEATKFYNELYTYERPFWTV